MASNGSGGSGSFNFPNATVQVVKIDPTSGYKRLDQFAIWNNDYEFAYPALATDDRGEVGIALGWGGENDDANAAVGILDDFVVWYPEASDFSTARRGDDITAHQASPRPIFSPASDMRFSKTRRRPGTASIRSTFCPGETRSSIRVEAATYISDIQSA